MNIISTALGNGKASVPPLRLMVKDDSEVKRNHPSFSLYLISSFPLLLSSTPAECTIWGHGCKKKMFLKTISPASHLLCLLTFRNSASLFKLHDITRQQSHHRLREPTVWGDQGFHQIHTGDWHDMTADEAQSDPTCRVAILLPPLPSPQIRDLHQLNINKSNLPSLGALPRDTRRMTLTSWFWCTCWKQVCFSGHLYRFVTWLLVSRISLKHYKNRQERHR